MSKKHFKTFKTISLLPVFFTFALTACDNTIKYKPIEKAQTINMGLPFTTNNDKAVETAKKFSAQLSAEVEKIRKTNKKYQKVGKLSFASKISEDYATLMQNINSDKEQFAFASASTVQKAAQKNFDPKIQTLTTAFKGDTQLSFYSETNNPLEELAKKANAMFWAPLDKSSTTPGRYSEWDDINRQFKDPRYNYFYDTTKTIPYYRGAIWLKGSQATLDEIKTAWKNRDWENFEKHGFLLGKPSSGAKYLMPEALFRKHFKEKFSGSFAKNALSKPKLYVRGKVPEWNKDNKYNDVHIGFDDQNSFAWTHNKDNKELYGVKPDEKLEIFMFTNPNLFNIGIFSKAVHPLKQDLILQAFKNLADTNRDVYGPSYGFNGYKAFDKAEYDSILNNLGY